MFQGTSNFHKSGRSTLTGVTLAMEAESVLVEKLCQWQLRDQKFLFEDGGAFWKDLTNQD